ncbi:D-glutamate deacylase [Stappia aggregata IAM 12614]|uniref:D-glutamate deacylase n=1 Tax=Roseibium aggregatum (strain ATCC 25650 / DSM 13394 / JCM 20685 / NBRC 16684 / NCIMB 2208 / IAM 12614 / B1) TaxID=384765 RepID=A0NUC7_ROSAI|nr:D-glutamate deacylase [Stappia aggregata IAM 12614] [Roseibium aggregatum IAM 12614]
MQIEKDNGMTKRKRLLVSTLILGVMSVVPAYAQNYDLVINNGRVMDPETNFDGVRNVGIKDGKIAAITEDAIQGDETIDASGHVVAPGFIEGHQHATDPFSRKVNLRDGLTTQMDFEAGAGDIAKWYAEAEGKTQANYGMVVLTTLARVSVLDSPEIAASANDMGGLFSMVGRAAAKAQSEGRKPGWTATLPNKEQMTEIMRLVDEGLRQGALGVGIPVGYMTTGVTQYELYKYQELASKYGRISNGHVRFAGVRPPTGGQLGVQEMLANAMVLDAPFLASHLNSNMDWEYTIPLINDARETRGAKVWGEVYPYAAGGTIASTDILTESSMAQMNITYSNVSNLDGTRWDKAMYEDVRKNDPGRSILIFNNPPEDIAKWMAQPGVVVVSDGMAIQDENLDYYPWDSPYEGKSVHPRSAGTRAKVLRMVREDKNMPLMEAISKMSYLHAKYFAELGGISQFRTKGRVQVGADADIVVFNPDTVTDNSTYEPGMGALPSTGIPYVLVNGVVVVKDSVVQKVFPGKPIRFPVQEKGRLDQITIEPREFDPNQ